MLKIQLVTDIFLSTLYNHFAILKVKELVLFELILSLEEIKVLLELIQTLKE